MNFHRQNFLLTLENLIILILFPAEIAEVSPYGFYREESHQARVMDIP